MDRVEAVHMCRYNLKWGMGMVDHLEDLTWLHSSPADEVVGIQDARVVKGGIVGKDLPAECHRMYGCAGLQEVSHHDCKRDSGMQCQKS